MYTTVAVFSRITEGINFVNRGVTVSSVLWQDLCICIAMFMTGIYGSSESADQLLSGHMWSIACDHGLGDFQESISTFQSAVSIFHFPLLCFS